MKRLTILLLFLGCCTIAAGQVTVKAGLINEFEISPGKIYHGEIIIENKGDRITQVKITQEARSSRSNLAWVSVKPARVELQPGSRAVVNITVRTPESIGQGSRWSSVDIEPLPGKKRGLNIILVYSCAVVTHSPGGKRDLKYLGAEYNQGKVRVKIFNKGDYVMVLKTELEIAGKFLRGPLKRAFPGYEKTIEFSVDLGHGQHSATAYFLNRGKLWTYEIDFTVD